MRLQFIVETYSKMCTTSSMLLSVFKGFKIIPRQGDSLNYYTLYIKTTVYYMRGHVLQVSVLLKLSCYNASGY